MKKLLSSVCLLFVTAFVNAQGLENIVVEKYYVSDQNDYDMSLTTSGDTLPVGSVTYRVYVDMLPGYNFQAAYGNIEHTLFFQTSTAFFNNSDRGASTPDGITKLNLKKNSVMLDSWLTVGSAGKALFGVPKSLDNGVALVNTDGMLQNNDVAAGIPVTTQDGLLDTAGTGVKLQTVTSVGIQSDMDG